MQVERRLLSPYARRGGQVRSSHESPVEDEPRMTLSEVGVVLLSLCAGYWALSRLFRPHAGRPSAEGNRRPARTPPDHAAWYVVLGVSPSASRDEIRRAYKSLLGRYHPDKAASLSNEMRELAERKSREITLAYRSAMRYRDPGR
jgi:DnaJ domain